MRDWAHYQTLVSFADVYLLGLPDVSLPELPGLTFVPLTPGSALSNERAAIVDSSAFGAVMFALDAGQLDLSAGESRYFEGYFSARAEVVQEAVNRLTEALGLSPAAPLSERDVDLTLSWSARLNTRFLEQLEGQKLAARAHTAELLHLADERKRLESVVRSYVGGRTWDEVQEAVDQGRVDVGEWRQELTLCFCDIADFTPLSERLHPFEVAGFLNEHFARLYDIVRAHGGYINKFIGDAMLAVFESPVEAFMASQKMVRASNDVDLPREFAGQGLRVRVGLNTGQVAVVNLGVPEHRERAVLGDAVNLSQRLQSLAQPRQVVVSAATFMRLPLSIARNLEPFETPVKGKRQPVQAYRWSVYSDRLAPNQSVVLRERLLSASRRTSLSERLKGDGTQ
jgi:class 3 adenylate cyclase